MRGSFSSGVGFLRCGRTGIRVFDGWGVGIRSFYLLVVFFRVFRFRLYVIFRYFFSVFGVLLNFIREISVFLFVVRLFGFGITFFLFFRWLFIFVGRVRRVYSRRLKNNY